MSNILDLATIKIEFKMRGSFLAKVVLNWQDEFEVRFCRITGRPDGSLWFQPPALKEFNWAKCFAVPNPEEWRRFEKKVTDQFLEELKEQVANGVYNSEILEKYVSAPKDQITEEDWEKIDQAIGNKNI